MIRLRDDLRATLVVADGRGLRAACVAALVVAVASVGAAAMASAGEDAVVVGALRCQRAVAAAAERFAASRDRNVAKCVGSLARCLIGRPGDGACTLRAIDACSAAYHKQATLEAGLRTSVRKRCGAAALLNADAVGFGRIMDRCAGAPGGGGDGVEAAIACLAEEHVCAGARALAAAVPRTAELLRTSGTLSSLPLGTSCLPEHAGAGDSSLDADGARRAARCVTAMLRAGDRDRQAWRGATGKCLGALFACAAAGGDALCWTRGAATCEAGFRKLPAVDPSAVGIDGSCAADKVPFAALADADGANLAALAATCRAVGIGEVDSVAAWRACVARTAACQASAAMAYVYPRGAELLATAGRAVYPPYCAGLPPSPTATPTAVPGATSTSATGAPTPSSAAATATGALATPTPQATIVTPTPTAPTPTAAKTATSGTTATPAPTPTGGGLCDVDPAPYGLTTRASSATCRLDGSPDQFPSLATEQVFPALAFDDPVQLTYAPDGSDRLFVVEQHGAIRVFPNQDDVTASTVFLDLGDVVQCCNEEGLLGLAFHPDYAANGYFYVYYSVPSPRRSVIARFRVSANPDVADGASGVVVMEIAQPYENHKGGQLAFGADGMLYVSLGDGGSGGDPQNRAQDLGTVLGKILRIDVDHVDSGLGYAVPPDNPFVGTAGARGEIWALGLRNPWRMSFDRLTHALFAGDVGQAEWEEIDLIERGKNYGWRRMEGNSCYDPPTDCNDGTLTLPLAVYGHAEGGCAVTGGFVYRGTRLPELYGAYVYGDYCTGKLWALRWDGAEATVQPLASSGLNPSSFGEDRDGELYIVNHLAGTIHRLRRPDGSPPGTFPLTLSATGCFADLATRAPAPGLVPYDVQSPLWSDGAGKRRFLVLPDGATIGHHAPGAWDFPVGTILVKEFTLELERGIPASARALETRFLVRRAAGWDGYTYRWNDAQTEAHLLDGASTETFAVTDPARPGTPIAHPHYFPSRSDCARCHNAPAGGALGLQTAQLNRTHDYGGVVDNQLRAFEHVGLFGGCLPARPAGLPRLADPADANTALAARARSYLHANCAQCHRPDGTAPTAIDLRAETAFADTGLCDALPAAGDLGDPANRLVKPGHAEASILWLRAAMRGDDQMPPLATLAPDPFGRDLLGAWIDSLAACP